MLLFLLILICFIPLQYFKIIIKLNHQKLLLLLKKLAKHNIIV